MKKEEIIRELMEELQARLSDREIDIKKVTKNNGVIWTAIIISLKDNKSMSASHYVDNIAQEILDGNMTIEEAVEGIIDSDEKAQLNSGMSQSWIDGLLNKEAILSRVHRNIINRELNKELLEEIPHKPFIDLEIVYRVQLSGHASFLVRNDLIKIHDITLEELDKAAYNNDKDNWTCETMREMFLSISGLDVGEDVGMLIITNNTIAYGAAAITDDIFMKEMSKKLGGDFFIIPSSINECIIIPKAMEDGIEYMNNMIREINTTQISERDILSNNLYRYDHESNKVMVA